MHPRAEEMEATWTEHGGNRVEIKANAATTTPQVRGRQEWKARITAFALTFRGTYTSIAKQVAVAIAHSELPGPCPHLTTLRAWLLEARGGASRQRAHAVQAEMSLRQLSEGEPARKDDTVPLGAAVEIERTNTPRAESVWDVANARLDAALARMDTVAKQLLLLSRDKSDRLNSDLFTVGDVAHNRRLRKGVRALRSGRWNRKGEARDPTTAHRLASRFEAEAARYEERLARAAARHLSSGEPSTDEGAVVAGSQSPSPPPHAQTPPGASLAADFPHAEAASHSEEVLGTTRLPLYRLVDAEPVACAPWGTLARVEPQPAFSTVVGRAKPSQPETDSAIRARLLAPVLNAGMSCRACAAAWQRVFRDRASNDERLLLPEIPLDYQVKYRNISARLLQKWRAKVLRDRELAAKRGASALPVVELLRHKWSARRTAPKATPDLINTIKRLHAEQPNWSAVNIADYLRTNGRATVNNRLVQRIIARISDRERLAARGGPAATDVFWRRRILREAPYPNRVWIMDHSFLKQEVRNLQHLEYLRQVTDFDFEFEFVVESGSIGRLGRRQRSRRKLCLTLIMDACSRMDLAWRAWPGAPDTRRTLLTLRDAMEKYGVPEFLYTDNGSDLKSGDVATALDCAGIHQVLSLPYSPEGRGKIEAMFRLIKHTVLQALPGYNGGRHDRVWADEDLLTLEEVEERIGAGIERLINGAIHGETGQRPSEHYAREVGARAFGRVADAAPVALLSLLLLEKGVEMRPEGIYVNGRRYLGPALQEIANGSRVWVRYDPLRPKTIHVLVPDASGNLRYVGPAEYYNKEHPAPELDAWYRMEQDWNTDQLAFVAKHRGSRAHRQIEAERAAAGERLATELAADIQRELVALPAPAAPSEPHTQEAAATETPKGETSTAVGDQDTTSGSEVAFSEPAAETVSLLPVRGGKRERRKAPTAEILPWS